MFIFKAGVPTLLNGTLLQEKIRKVHLRHSIPREKAAMMALYRPRLLRFEKMELVGRGRDWSGGVGRGRLSLALSVVTANCQCGRFAFGILKFLF